jgi:dipeptidyl aminopeptidase/acylaminoacyl peptidase
MTKMLMHCRRRLAIWALLTATIGLMLGSFGASAQSQPDQKTDAQEPPATLMPAALATEEELPTAEAILDGLVEATGGVEAYAKLENRIMSGSIEFVSQELSIPFTVYQGRPIKQYILSESVVFGRFESGTDGDVVWEKSQMSGSLIKEGQERDIVLMDATFDAIPNWRKYFDRVELVGVEEIDGRACYKLWLESKTGIELTSYLDRETNLPVKTEITLDLPAGRILVESWPSDYREVDGIVIPHVNRQMTAGQARVTTLERIEHNVELPAGVFELPADIRELLTGQLLPQEDGTLPTSSASPVPPFDDRPVLTDQERMRFNQQYRAPSLVRDRSIKARWFEDGTTFWFEDSRGKHFVDPVKKEIRKLEQEKHAQLKVEDRRRQGERDYAPGFDRHVTVKDGNLLLHQGDSGEGIPLTQDAEEDIAWDIDWDNMPSVWSPDGTRLLALRWDERKVHHLPIIDYTEAEETVREVVYGKAGGSFTSFELAVFDPESKKKTVIDTGSKEDIYIYPVGWREDGSELLFFRVTRDAKQLDLMAASPGTGASRTIVTERQETSVGGLASLMGGWYHCYTPIEGTDRFLWISERSGWSHIYLYDMKGNLIRPLTQGTFPVQKVVAVDPAKGYVFFMANAEDRLYDTHLYRIDLAGGGLRRLTSGTGEHEVQVSPSRQCFVDTHSSNTRPPVSELRSADGELLLELAKADTTGLEDIGWTPPEEFIAKADDGITDLYGVLFKPRDFDPSKRYPVIDFIYAGPFIMTVPNSYAPFNVSAGRAGAMAELGFVTFIVDCRGTTERGKAFQDASFGRIGQIEIPDHVAVLKQLVAERPYMDLDRVGICGGSWGGYFALRGMLTAPDVFHVGVAMCPGDLTGSQPINEPYMGLPEDNPEGYAAGSNPALAANLKGRLLMIHGTADQAAPFSNTMRMASALIQAGKIHDLAVIPQADHHFHGLYQRYIMERMISYFREHLAGD